MAHNYVTIETICIFHKLINLTDAYNIR